MRFRGREMMHQDLGLELLKRIETDLSDQAVVEQEPQSEATCNGYVTNKRKLKMPKLKYTKELPSALKNRLWTQKKTS